MDDTGASYYVKLHFRLRPLFRRRRLSPMSVADPLSFLDTHWIGRMGLTSGGLEDSLGAGGNSLSGLAASKYKKRL